MNETFLISVKEIINSLAEIQGTKPNMIECTLSNNWQNLNLKHKNTKEYFEKLSQQNNPITINISLFSYMNLKEYNFSAIFNPFIQDKNDTYLYDYFDINLNEDGLYSVHPKKNLQDLLCFINKEYAKDKASYLIKSIIKDKVLRKNYQTNDNLNYNRK